MTCAILLSVPPSATPHHQSLFSQRGWFFTGMKWSQVPTTAAPIPSDLTKYPSNLIPLCSPSSTPLVEESSVEDGASVLPQPTNVSLRGCKACGKEEIEKNCNGEGRIQGGIATVPGFGWWPIKAYRPCPGFLASGGRYRRRGQTMDEVTSGVGKREPSVRTVNEVKQNKKK